MAKSQKEEPEKEHSQSLKGRPEGTRPRKKAKSREITHYFSKIERPQASNPNLPTIDKALLEHLDQQTQQLLERERQLSEMRDDLRLKLSSQKEEHDRMIGQMRVVVVSELKAMAQIDRVVGCQRQSQISHLHSQIKYGKDEVKDKQEILQSINQTSMQHHFLRKQLTRSQSQLKTAQLQLQTQLQRQRLAAEEQNCYLSKQCWPLLNKRYQTLSLIGKGGFSQVYKAYDLEGHAQVAVKLSEVEHLLAGRGSKHDYLKHIKREYEVHKRLSHPNIVALIEVIEVDNAICIVMDHCEGPTLAEMLRGGELLGEAEAKLVVGQMLEVISYLSGMRIVHYDLKPENIMFQKGVLKVLDFGICKVIDNQHSKMALTSQGVGTYCYLPPETFAASNPLLSNKVDIWSMGVIFYELLYGTRPATRSHELNAKGQLIFPAGTEVSEQAKLFIQGCLKQNLTDRMDPSSALAHPYFQ